MGTNKKTNKMRTFTLAASLAVASAIKTKLQTQRTGCDDPLECIILSADDIVDKAMQLQDMDDGTDGGTGDGRPEPDLYTDYWGNVYDNADGSYYDAYWGNYYDGYTNDYNDAYWGDKYNGTGDDGIIEDSYYCNYYDTFTDHLAENDWSCPYC